MIFERTEFYRRKMKRNLQHTIVRSNFQLPWLNSRIYIYIHIERKARDSRQLGLPLQSSSSSLLLCCCFRIALAFFPLLKCMLTAIVRAFGSHTLCICYFIYSLKSTRDKNQIFYYYFYNFSFVLSCLVLLCVGLALACLRSWQYSRVKSAALVSMCSRNFNIQTITAVNLYASHTQIKCMNSTSAQN